MKNKNIALDLLIVISPKGKGEKILAKLGSKVNFTSITIGNGTATSDIMSALGIGEPEKDLFFTFCEDSSVPEIYDAILEVCPIGHNGAVAMTVPVSAVSGNLTLQVLLGNTKKLV